MIPTRGDGGPVGRRSDLGGGDLACVGSITELAREVTTPGPKSAVRPYGHRVLVSNGDGVPGGCPGRFLNGGVLADRSPVSKLTFVIVAPDPEGAVRLERDGVSETSGDGGPVVLRRRVKGWDGPSKELLEVKPATVHLRVVASHDLKGGCLPR